MSYMKKKYIDGLYDFMVYTANFNGCDDFPKEKRDEFYERWFEFSDIVTALRAENRIHKEKTRLYIAQRRKTDKNYARKKVGD